MSGSRRPRMLDRIRARVGRQKLSPPPSTAMQSTAASSSSLPASAPTPSTNNRTQRFLELALQDLTISEKETVLGHLAANTEDVVSAVDKVYSAVLSKKRDCESEKWRWTFRGKEIVLRDEAEKVLLLLDRIKDVGDIVANVDPVHVGLPWAGIRLLLKTAVAEHHQMAALLTGMRLTFSIANRLEAYSIYLQRLPAVQSTDNFEKYLVSMYTHVLRFMATAIQTYQRNYASRIWLALWDTSVIEDFEKECDRLAVSTEIAANGCDRELLAQDRERAKQWKAELDISLHRLDDIAGIQSAVDDLHLKFDLSSLQPAPGATYDSHADEHMASCLAGTRTDLLNQVITWADDLDGKGIFWLCGKAGTGKSTISRTVADRLNKQGQLGASFFFKRGEGDRGNASRFFATIVFQLINVIPAMGRPIAAALEADPLLCQRKLQDQYEQLLSKPLLDATQHGQSWVTIVVIDALDECDRHQDIRMILKLLAQVQSIGGISLRIFVTSRPETPIQIGFKDIHGALHKDVVLEEVQASTIEHDIRIYFRHRFHEIRREHALLQTYEPLPAAWPQPDRIEALVSLANPLFIFASTVCRYISQRDPQEGLESLMDSQKRIPLSGLNGMYSSILDGTLLDQDVFERDQVLDDFRTVVGPAVMLVEPLSAESLAKVLNVSLSVIDRTMRPLHSVLHIPASCKSPIRLLHLSFGEFLTDPLLKSSNKFYVDKVQTHTQLSQSCLQLLSQPGVLSNDLCKAEVPGTRRRDYSADQVAACIQPDVAYSCCHWAWHTVQSKQELHDDGQVHCFLQQHFLHWLEALSWLGRLSSAIGFLSELQSEAKGLQLSKFIQDANRFLLHNRYMIDIAPLQTYYSALVFAPAESLIRTSFEHSASRFFSRLPTVPLKWSPEIGKLEGHSSWVRALAFSPDGSVVASASYDGEVRLWKVSTGEEMYRLEGHNNSVEHIVFSPDELLVALASYDGTVRLWDTSTGEQTYQLEGYKNSINAVAFSSNGLLIASALYGYIILRLWNASTGEETHIKLEGPREKINAIALSPNGLLLASACSDRTIQIWNTSTGKETYKLEGHGGRVNAVAFSPDGLLLASASSDWTVRLWKVSTGESSTAEAMRTLKGHRSFVSAVAFCPFDGSVVASMSDDWTVRLWNASTGEETYKLGAKDAAVNAIALSPDGSIVATASTDRTVRLWKVSTEEVSTAEATRQPEGNTGQVTGVTFSPDGSVVVSASYGTLRLWNTLTGEEMYKLEGHSDIITTVAFSPDGSFIASASFDMTLRLWNQATGREVRLFELTDCIYDLAFSEDGRLVRTNRGDFDSGLQCSKFSSNLAPSSHMQLKKHWICLLEQEILWLPSEFRGGCPAEIYGNVLVIGHLSGNLSFFECS